MQKPMVLFDFDGVIADSFHIAHAVAKKLCVYLTETEYRKGFNGNIYDSYNVIKAADHGDRCDHALDWWGEFSPGFRTHARPFEGMSELLNEFARNYTLCVVSSGHDPLIKEFLEKYGLRTAIDGIYGVEVNPRKDEKFRTIFSKYAIGPDDCVFITDTLGDINEASSVGLKSIGVTWGFQDRHTLERGHPFRIVEAPQELPEAVESYFASVS
jgi:phosphoglycolate phosphatase-like HAD superfamily hydrolase